MTIPWLCLLVCVAASTAIWPVAKWGLAKDGHVRAMGFWTSLTSLLVCTAALSLDLGPAGSTILSRQIPTCWRGRGLQRRLLGGVLHPHHAVP